MSQIRKEKPYDLEERTFQFAQRAIDYFKNLSRTVSNIEIAKQGIRSSGSVGLILSKLMKRLVEKTLLYLKFEFV